MVRRKALAGKGGLVLKRDLRKLCLAVVLGGNVANPAQRTR